MSEPVSLPVEIPEVAAPPRPTPPIPLGVVTRIGPGAHPTPYPDEPTRAYVARIEAEAAAIMALARDMAAQVQDQVTRLQALRETWMHTRGALHQGRQALYTAYGARCAGQSLPRPSVPIYDHGRCPRCRARLWPEYEDQLLVCGQCDWFTAPGTPSQALHVAGADAEEGGGIG